MGAMKMTVDELLRGIELGPGMTWADGQGIMMLEGAAGGGHRLRWKAYLVLITPATGPEGEGSRLYVHRVDIPSEVRGGVLGPVDEEALRTVVEAQIRTFQMKLDAGLAQEIQDGGDLP